MKLTKQKLEEIIKEELSNLMEGGYAGHYVSNYPSREPGYGIADPEKQKRVKPPVWHGKETEESLNPEWDKADKILSDLVHLADALERSKDSEPDKLAFAVVRKLRSAVDAMEARLNEKFATLEPEPEGEGEALHLSTPTEDPWKLKRRLGLGGSVHDRLGGPRHREEK